MLKRTGKSIVCCLLVLILCFFSSSCGYINFDLISLNSKVMAKEDIISNIDSVDTSGESYQYISSHLKKHGIGNLNTFKLNSIEVLLDDEFYQDLPADHELAKTIAQLFVEYFYDTIDLSNKEEVTDAVLKCLFASIGDPYAYYRTASEYEQYIQDLLGGEEFVGIGVMMNADTFEILMVIPDSGAEEAGIMPRDIIWGVDGKTVEDTEKDVLSDMLRGEEGSTVEVTVKRGDELITYTVTRKVLQERSVYYSIDEDNIGVIQITQFVQTTNVEFEEAVDYCIERGVGALIIDVRYNPGGIVDTAAAVVDYLAPDKEGRRIISYTQAGYDDYVYYTTDGHSVDIPIAIICNGGTASAGELFTAALRDYNAEGIMDVVIVGDVTYGKGVVQTSRSLYDLSGITYTIGYCNPPSNVSYNGLGITPDIMVEEVEETDLPYDTAKAEVIKLINSHSGANTDLGAAA